jgi:hypothetical protein
MRRSLPNRLGQHQPNRDGIEAWDQALARVGVDHSSDLPTLDQTIQRLGLEYTVRPARSGAKRWAAPGASAIVWSGGKWRDPEVPYGEATSASSPAAALAEALARFLIKDPGYPIGKARHDVPRPVGFVN